MKQHQKLGQKKEAMINRRKRSKATNEVQPVEKINKNLYSFQGKSQVQKEVTSYAYG